MKAPLRAKLVKAAFDRLLPKVCPICGQKISLEDLIKKGGAPVAIQVKLAQRKEWVHVRHHGVEKLIEE